MGVEFGEASRVASMRAPRILRDATGSVSIGDAHAVADAVHAVLTRCFGPESFDANLLRASFTLVEHVFEGEHPRYLACDMPYHDLRHSLDTALVMARMIDGYRVEHANAASHLTAEYGLLGVLLALLHDVGFIRKASEAALCGPQLMAEHERRSVEFAECYLKATSLARHAALASLILATRLSTNLDELFACYEKPAVTLGMMLGSADLLSQVSDRCYPERCYYHLYHELVLGGCDRVRRADGRERVLYHDALELLRNTPGFYEAIVRKRLDRDFGQVSGALGAHFRGANPYDAAICDNLERVGRVLGDGGTRLLRRNPITTTRNLAAVYTRPAGRA